jgi:hypothetical protein
MTNDDLRRERARALVAAEKALEDAVGVVERLEVQLERAKMARATTRGALIYAQEEMARE